MNNHFITIIIAISVGFLGGYLGSQERSDEPQITNSSQPDSYIDKGEDSLESDLSHELQLELIKYKVEQLETQLEALVQQTNITENTENLSQTKSINRSLSAYARPVQPNEENLVAAGISNDDAKDILRRISQQEYRRLELQNLVRRSKGVEAQQYRNELRELNTNKISLRNELGDQAYDQYLFESGQNNRVKVSSVMSGSPAESSGFENNDIIISYDDLNILDWNDIRRATLDGEIGSYTTVEILRNGDRMSLMVPRGTLGVQLEPVQLDPVN